MCLPLLGDDVFTSLYDVLGSGLPAFLLLLAAFLLPQSPWCFYCWRRRHKKALEMCSRCHNVSTREQNCVVDNQCNIFDWIFLPKYFCDTCAQAQDFFLEKVRIFWHIMILCEWIMVSLYKFWSHCICPHLYFYLQLDLYVLVTCTCIWNCMKMYLLLAFPSLVFLVLSPEWKGWAIRQTVKVVPSQGTPPQWPTVTRRGESRISNCSKKK